MEVIRIKYGNSHFHPSGVLTKLTGKRERVSVHIPSVKVMIVKVEAVTERI